MNIFFVFKVCGAQGGEMLLQFVLLGGQLSNWILHVLLNAHSHVSIDSIDRGMPLARNSKLGSTAAVGFQAAFSFSDIKLHPATASLNAWWQTNRAPMSDRG